MITLITGALGTGKTALAVKLLTEHSYYPDNAVIVGVREWQGGGAYYPLQSMQNATANQKMIEDIGRLSGTIYFVDEGKKIWPSRIAGKPAPEFIDSHLAESRSIAQDWIITAQTPTQLDVALRRLVGRHIHLERNALGIKYSESGQVRDDLQVTHCPLNRPISNRMIGKRCYRSKRHRTFTIIFPVIPVIPNWPERRVYPKAASAVTVMIASVMTSLLTALMDSRSNAAMTSLTALIRLHLPAMQDRLIDADFPSFEGEKQEVTIIAADPFYFYVKGRSLYPDFCHH